MHNRRWLLLVTVILAVAGLRLALHAGQNAARSPDADWPMYNRDLAGTRYSPLTQINTENVSQLRQVWSYRFNREGKPVTGPSSFELFQEVTPIVVNDVMFMPAGDRVVALEPETGQEIWVHELEEGLASFRGVGYWAGDDETPPRILFTSARKIIALNAYTGERVGAFGTDGEITLEVAYAGAPTIYKNTMLIGSNFFGPGEPHVNPGLSQPRGQDGDPRGFDVRTGERIWRYNTIPRPGEPGNETWGLQSWRDRTGNNVWAVALTVDENAGIVYLPVSTPGANYYGGDRPGNNEPANSVLALDAETGELKWYFQTIHHELWDYNLPPAPGLIDIQIDGEVIPALAQVGKSGWMYILNRLTGEPVFGIEEQPVAAGDVPGEWYSPTQPIPIKPPAIARVGFDPEVDMVTAEDTTAEHAAACRQVWEENRFYNAGPYTPFNLRSEGTPPSLVFPSLTGGSNWGGTATDPDLGYVFVNTKDQAATGWTIPNPDYREETAYEHVPYTRGGGPGFSAPATNGNGSWPCYKPPWASLIAVDASTGDIAWSVPLGVDDSMPEGRQNVGSPGAGGPMVTAGGLVFIGATNDRRFRAFDSRTGEELWSAEVPYNITAVPMTYEGDDGRQYVAVVAARAAGGGGRGGRGQGVAAGVSGEALFVYALPE